MVKEILAVDDDKHIADLLKVVLEEEGYKVVPVYSGQECLEKLKQMKPDLILLDIQMPKMNGWQVLEAIKQDKRTKDIPVAMLTGTEAELDEEAMREKGVEDYILKPFVHEDLLRRVKRILK